MSSDSRNRCSDSPQLGQSVWIDFLSRESIRGGHLQKLISTTTPSSARPPTRRSSRRRWPAGDAYEEQLRELDEEGLNSEDASGRWPSRTSARPATCSAHVRGERPPRRLRLARGRPAPGLRHAGDVPRGDAPARGGRPAQPDGQDPRDQAGARRDRGRDRQGPLDQRHADLLARALRGGRRVLHARARAPGRRGRRPEEGRVGRELLRLAHRHRGRPPARGDRRPRRAEGQARRRQREARLRALQGGLRRAALGVPAPRAPRRSGCCGPRRRSRTPTTPTRCTSRS